MSEIFGIVTYKCSSFSKMNHFKGTIKSFADGKICYISHDYMWLCEKYIWSLISDCYALRFYILTYATICDIIRIMTILQLTMHVKISIFLISIYQNCKNNFIFRKNILEVNYTLYCSFQIQKIQISDLYMSYSLCVKLPFGNHNTLNLNFWC